MLRLTALLLSVTLVTVACSDGGEAVDVYAASSLTDVLPRVVARYQMQHSDADINLVFGGSQVLATQIDEGAPADIYIAANRTQAQRLVDANVATRPVVLAESTLVIAVRKDAPWLTVDEIAEARPRVAVAASGVPVGGLTEAALDAMEPSIADALRAGIVTRDPSVRVVLSRVELGEADVAFVYATDIPSADGVRAIALGEQPPSNQYVAALVTYGGQVPGSDVESFFTFLAGTTTETAFVEFGFPLVAGN